MNTASASGNASYSTQYLKASIDQSKTGADYITEAGYIRRTGFYELTSSVGIGMTMSYNKIS